MTRKPLSWKNTQTIYRISNFTQKISNPKLTRIKWWTLMRLLILLSMAVLNGITILACISSSRKASHPRAYSCAIMNFSALKDDLFLLMEYLISCKQIVDEWISTMTVVYLLWYYLDQLDNKFRNSLNTFIVDI